MKSNSIIFKSWMMLFVAVLSWCGIAAFVVILVGMESERAAYTEEVAAATVQEGQAAQLHAVARETVAQREAIERVARADVLTAVNKIEAIRSSSVQVRVTGAQAEKSSQGKNGAASVNVVMLTAHAEGPFADILHIIEMLENLPLVASVHSLNMSRTVNDSSNKNNVPIWALDVRMRLITTAALPS